MAPLSSLVSTTLPAIPKFLEKLLLRTLIEANISLCHTTFTGSLPFMLAGHQWQLLPPSTPTRNSETVLISSPIHHPNKQKIKTHPCNYCSTEGGLLIMSPLSSPSSNSWCFSVLRSWEGWFGATHYTHFIICSNAGKTCLAEWGSLLQTHYPSGRKQAASFWARIRGLGRMDDILSHNLALSTACMNNNKENNHNHNADKILPQNKRIMQGRYVNSERERMGIY